MLEIINDGLNISIPVNVKQSLLIVISTSKPDKMTIVHTIALFKYKKTNFTVDITKKDLLTNLVMI